MKRTICSLSKEPRALKTFSRSRLEVSPELHIDWESLERSMCVEKFAKEQVCEIHKIKKKSVKKKML